jgi:hypothetical protein
VVLRARLESGDLLLPCWEMVADPCQTGRLALALSIITRCDKVILIYDSLFILLKSLTLNLHVDIGASISKLVSVHPNFVALVVLDWWMEIQ